MGSLPATITACIAVITVHRNDRLNDAIDGEPSTDLSSITGNLMNDDLQDLRQDTYGAVGFIAALAGFAVGIECMMTVVRICVYRKAVTSTKVKVFYMLVRFSITPNTYIYCMPCSYEICSEFSELILKFIDRRFLD